MADEKRAADSAGTKSEPIKGERSAKATTPKTKVESGHKPVRKGATAKVRPHRQIHPGGGGESPPKHKGKGKVTEEDRFLWAEGEQESGNNYDAVNANSGALGRWQVMPSNLPGWLRESGLRQMTSGQFLANHKAQDKLARTILGGYFKKYGPAGAAAEWYSGQSDPTKTYGDPPVYQYVDDVLKLMNSPEVAPVTQSGIAVPLPWQLPKVSKTDTWAAQIQNSSDKFSHAAKTAHSYSTLIRNERPRMRG